MSDFHVFHTVWFEYHRQLVAQLSRVADDNYDGRQQLIQKVMSHHCDYYRAKSAAAQVDVLILFLAPWATALERSLSWIGGWRPVNAFHLVYTESSALFESRLVDILRGLHAGDLRDLSSPQFLRLSELQTETVQQENDISKELSIWQADLPGAVGVDVAVKMEELKGILGKADNLRRKTIEALVAVLTPKQAAQFLVAEAELHFGIRAWGAKHDGRRYSS